MAAPYLAVVGLAVACYTNSLFGEFVHDDIVAVARNPDVLGSSGFGQLFANDFWGTPLSDPRSHKSYRPLTTLSFREEARPPSGHGRDFTFISKFPHTLHYNVLKRQRNI
ncbi:hypothetical protein J6590_031465 [Homalodisca vitripennis]|nr:hypothetical protein J6590_031465 [Homalodisca vitripennis]